LESKPLVETKTLAELGAHADVVAEIVARAERLLAASAASTPSVYDDPQLRLETV
jgi:hypothetical protein